MSRNGKSVKSELKSLKRSVRELKNDQELKEQLALPLGAVANTFVPTINALGCLSISSGSSYNERNGREITPQKLTMCLYINGGTTPSPPVAGTIRQPWRCIIFQDMSGTDAPSVAQILNSPELATGGRYTNIYTDYNTDYVQHKGDRKNRYKILYDKVGIGCGPTSTDIRKALMFNISISGKRLAKINYSDDLGTSARSGKLYCLFVHGISGTATDNNEYYLYNKLDFFDS